MPKLPPYDSLGLGDHKDAAKTPVTPKPHAVAPEKPNKPAYHALKNAPPKAAAFPHATEKDRKFITQPVSAAEREAEAFFMQHGRDAKKAAGMTANLSRESKMDPTAEGDHGKALGLAQWQKRQEQFKELHGQSMRDSAQHDPPKLAAKKQETFFDWELKHGADPGARKAGKLIEKAPTAGKVAEIIAVHDERPANTKREAEVRKGRAEVLYNDLVASGNAKPTGTKHTTSKTASTPQPAGKKLASRLGPTTKGPA